MPLIIDFTQVQQRKENVVSRSSNFPSHLNNVVLQIEEVYKSLTTTANLSNSQAALIYENLNKLLTITTTQLERLEKIHQIEAKIQTAQLRYCTLVEKNNPHIQYEALKHNFNKIDKDFKDLIILFNNNHPANEIDNKYAALNKVLIHFMIELTNLENMFAPSSPTELSIEPPLLWSFTPPIHTPTTQSCENSPVQNQAAKKQPYNEDSMDTVKEHTIQHAFIS